MAPSGARMRVPAGRSGCPRAMNALGIRFSTESSTSSIRPSAPAPKIESSVDGVGTPARMHPITTNAVLSDR
jgi:hypothetical protein